MSKADELDFLSIRQTGIGGSDIGAILGVSRFKSVLDIYESKVNPIEEVEHNELFYWGHKLEDVIIDRFVEETGFGNVVRHPPVMRDKYNHWALAHADALIQNDNNETVGILEIKTASAFNSKAWSTDDGDSIPIEYSAQVQWYMGIYGVDVAYVAVLIGGNKYRQYKIVADKELFNLMLSRAAEFWRNHVLKNIPPEPKNSKEIERLFKIDDGQSVEASTAVVVAYNDLKELKLKEKMLKEEIENLEFFLKKSIGTNAQMNLNGECLYSWRTSIRNSFNTRAFKEAYPDLHKQFTKPTEIRVLRT